MLRGFEYVDVNYCACLMDFGISFDKTLCAGADGAYDLYLGSGVIVNTRPTTTGVECWKVSSPSSSKGRNNNLKNKENENGERRSFDWTLY